MSNKTWGDFSGRFPLDGHRNWVVIADSAIRPSRAKA